MTVSPSLSPSRDSSNSEKSDPRPPGSAREVSHWLLDGYNVLHAALLPGELRHQTRWWNQEGRERLIRRVCSFDGFEENHRNASNSKESETKKAGDGLGIENEQGSPIIWIVFDGERPAPEAEDFHPGIRMIFEPSADDYLVSRSRRADPSESIFVVSSDKRVVGRCAHAGAQIVKPRDFLARCPETEP